MTLLLFGVLAVMAAAASTAYWIVIRMPGRSFHGEQPPISPAELELRDRLGADLQRLAGRIGERNVERPAALAEAERLLAGALADAGCDVTREAFDVGGVSCANLIVEVPGKTPEIVLVGAHYDSVEGSPGANDNGTGTVALLALARSLRPARPERTLRLVLFVNEEPPRFQTDGMGSLRHARGCRQRGEQVAAMLSLETMGYFRDEPGSQQYPFPFSLFYPSRGDFIAFVGDVRSRPLVHRAIRTFRGSASMPSEGVAAPADIPGIGWSDQWAFWQEGYPGVMVTDTAPFRYPQYHTADDVPARVDLDRLARVVLGIEAVVRELAGAP